ncbi:MAG: hypothetical protein VX966_01255 [Chloroflexota bacterium]|nr:hypothetical protein [Chloroflexota bacterium]
MRIFKLILMGLLTLMVLGCSGDNPDVTQEMQEYMQDVEATVEARLAEERAIENRIEAEVEAKIAEMVAFAERYGSGERIATATPAVVVAPTVAAPTVAAPTVAAPTVAAPTATPTGVVAPIVVAEPTVVEGTVDAPVESVIVDDSTACPGYGQYTVSGTVAGYPDGTRVLGVVGDIYVGSTMLAAAYYELIIDLCAEDGTSLENQYMKFNVGGKTADQEVILTSGGNISRQLTVP